MLKLSLIAGMLTGLVLAPQEPAAIERSGTLIRERSAPIVVDTVAREILLPEGRVPIEGRLEVEFTQNGRRLVVPHDVRFLVDGAPVDGRLTLRPGQELVLTTPEGERCLLVGGVTFEELGARGQIQAALAQGVRAEASTVERVLWLGVDPQQDPSRHKGRFRVDANDSVGAFELVVEDGKVQTLRIDGEDVPPEQIEVQGRRVRALAPDGKLRLALDLGMHGGVTWSEHSAARAFAGLSVTAKEDEGHLVVTRVVPASPAESAGLRADDVIVALEGVHGLSKENLINLLRRKKPGEAVNLELLRDGRVQRVVVRLGEPPPAGSPPDAGAGAQDFSGAWQIAGTAEVVRRLAGEHAGALQVRRFAAEAAPAAPDPRIDRLLEHLERVQERLTAMEARLQELR